jgi:transcriptional regulator with XRE-family HTH domain
MSHFSDEIDRQLLQSNQSVDDIVRKTGLTRSLVYLWKRGEQTSVAEEQLSALAPALSSDIADHAALVRAHLLDEKFGPGSELVSVGIDDPGLPRDRPRPRSKAEKAIQFLSEERLKNRDLNDLLLDLARCLGAEL